MEAVFRQLYLTTPARRFAAGALATGGLLVSARPEAMFEDEQPRPWSMVVDSDETTVTPTMLPWWLAAGGVGLYLGLMY